MNSIIFFPKILTSYDIIFNTPYMSLYGMFDVISSLVIPLEQPLARIRVNMKLGINIDMI